jgi:GT2 family glycosyltransferase
MISPKISIVIPFYNGYQMLHQLLFDLYKHGNRPEEVIVVNDASEDGEVYGGLDWWKSSGMLNIIEKRNKENQGFLLSANRGLKSAKGDVVILISNDVRVQCNLVQLIYEIYKSERGLYDPVVGGRLLDFDTGWNVFGGKIYSYLEGWLLAATSKQWKNLEYFDESFAPSDYEDVDFSTKAKEYGYDLKPLNDDRISHTGGQTYKYDETRRERTERNREIFRKKWVK